jgi:hypothetical protein
MKFSSAVDVTQRENRFLRNLVHALILVIGLLTIVDLLLYDRSPIMVERTSHGLEVVRSADLLRKPSDVEDGIRLMMKARFNTDAKSPELFLTPKELLMRVTEQKEMSARALNQSVIVRTIHLGKDEATVDLDRVIAIADLRSAVKTKVRITFEEVAPNELNPYGLLLSTAEPVQAPTPIKEEKSR